jgi:hypothetical protein
MYRRILIVRGIENKYLFSRDPLQAELDDRGYEAEVVHCWQEALRKAPDFRKAILCDSLEVRVPRDYHPQLLSLNELLERINREVPEGFLMTGEQRTHTKEQAEEEILKALQQFLDKRQMTQVEYLSHRIIQASPEIKIGVLTHYDRRLFSKGNFHRHFLRGEPIWF